MLAQFAAAIGGTNRLALASLAGVRDSSDRPSVKGRCTLSGVSRQLHCHARPGMFMPIVPS